MFGSNNLQSVQLLGLLDAAKTGNPTVDGAIAVVLPIVVSSSLGFFWNNSKGASSGLANSLLPFHRWFGGKHYTQTIIYRSFLYAGAYMKNFDNDSQNECLVRAIKLYIDQKCDIDLDDADVELSDVAKRKSEKNREASSTKKLLDDCEIIKRPPQATWVCAGLFGESQVWLWMRDSVSETNGSVAGGGNSEKQIRTITITLRSSNKSSIDEFTRKALEWYEQQLAKLDTFTRYFFDVSSFSDGTRKELRSPVYKNYVLTGEKTFKTIFSQPARKLAKLVDDFRLKRGKYGVEGFPYKLGILLHGAPGTGKTSIIKALAQHLGRHIVNVSLSKIEKNQDLRDIFFNREGFQRNLSYKSIIFVLEDVDAASKVVTRRKELNAEPKDEGESKTRGQSEPTDPTSTDALSLAGILNVFDGVVATPGRIIVMTTNHPELLDPALIRPGRIDKIIELSYMTAVDAIEMLEHYFAVVMDKAERSQLTKVFEKGAIVTPAEMERHILEVDTIQEVIDAIDKRKRRRCSGLQ